MTLPLTVRARAEADLDQAYGWYEMQQGGRIARQAEAHPEVHGRVRRASLQRFPYGVFYVVRKERIDVLAVYHARRRPRAFDP